VNTNRDRLRHTLEASGRIDAASAPLLDSQLAALCASGALDVVLDLTEVTYMSSSGMRVLLLALRRQQAAGGSLVLRGIPDRVMRVLQVAGFDRVFPIEGELPADGEHCAD